MPDSAYDGAAPPPIVRTPRLLIRAWRREDAPLIKAAIDASLDHLRPWMPWAHREPSPLPEVETRLETFGAMFREGKDWIYGIFDADEQRVIGGTGLHPRIGQGALEIGYWIAAADTGNGYATEAAAALTRVGVELCDVERMEIRCDPLNAASAAIPGRLGYRHTGTLAGNVTDHEGNPRDSMVWVMPRDAYGASNAATRPVSARDDEGNDLL